MGRFAHTVSGSTDFSPDAVSDYSVKFVKNSETGLRKTDHTDIHIDMASSAGIV